MRNDQDISELEREHRFFASLPAEGTRVHEAGAPTAAGMALPDGVPMQARLVQVQVMQALGRNPFLEAAGVLLRALADMPRELSPEGVAGLRELLSRELHLYTQLCDRANLRRDHMLAVRYALCTALDEAANLRPWGGGEGGTLGSWSGAPLLQEFHQESDGGHKTFLLMGRLASQSDEHMPVLEVMLHLLGLDFEGHYRAQADGKRMLETIRHRLYTLVAASREPVPRELSPHWRGVGAGRFRLLRRVPVWVSASVFGLAAFGLFAWFKYEIAQAAAVLERRIHDIGQLRAPERAPVRLAELLAREIEAGRLSVADGDAASTVTFKGDDMFLAGQARISAAALPLLARVGQELQRLAQSGAVQVDVIGHSDNQPIATAQFPNNQALSLQRAQAVSRALQDAMLAPTPPAAAAARGASAAAGAMPAPAATPLAVSFKESGVGDTRPVADNTSAAGRARNRRVELIVTRP